MTCIILNLVYGIAQSTPQNVVHIWTWIQYITFQLTLISIYRYHLITQTLIFQPMHTTWQMISFWPKFYWSLFGPTPQTRDPTRRSIFQIISNPVPPFNTQKGYRSQRAGRHLTTLSEKFCCYSYYQSRGAYANINQHHEEDLNKALRAATKPVTYFDDPLRLSVPYKYLAKHLPEPPDGCTMRLLAIGAIATAFMMFLLNRLSIVLVRKWHSRDHQTSALVKHRHKRRNLNRWRRKHHILPTVFIYRFDS